MSSFTPGPWRYVRENGSPTTGQHMIAGAVPGYLAQLRDCGSGDVTANARLIAAAPDLLEALIWMVENDETFEGDTPLPDHHGATWNEINAYWIAGLNRARAAIAKATGEGE